MVWRNEIEIHDWNDRPVTVGEDTDGDVGIIDARGYSIIIKPAAAKLLRDWLDKFISGMPSET